MIYICDWWLKELPILLIDQFLVICFRKNKEKQTSTCTHTHSQTYTHIESCVATLHSIYMSVGETYKIQNTLNSNKCGEHTGEP